MGFMEYQIASHMGTNTRQQSSEDKEGNDKRPDFIGKDALLHVIELL